MSAPESFAPRRDEPLFGRLAIIGIGLIGSSIAHAAKELNLAGHIVLSDADGDVRRRARGSLSAMRSPRALSTPRATPTISCSACRSAPAARSLPRSPVC